MKRSANTKITPTKTKHRRPNSIKSTKTSLPQDSNPIDLAPDIVTINQNYQYSAEDINAVILARLDKDHPNIHVLAAATLDLPSSISEQLNLFFQAVTTENLAKAKIILPILKNKHWMGLVLTLQEGKINHISYYNSLPTTKKGIEKIKEELLEQLKQTSRLIKEVEIERPEEQPFQADKTSCGALLVENFIADVTETSWDWEKLHSNDALLELRRTHLAEIKEKNPSHYAKFSQQSLMDLPPRRQIRNQTGNEENIPNGANRFRFDFASPEPRRPRRKKPEQSPETKIDTLLQLSI